MLANRSIPECTVIPELAYADIGQAINWLCDAFDFTLRLRIANHRARLNVGEGAVVLIEQDAGDASVNSSEQRPGDLRHSVMVRVSDAKGHHQRAKEHGARILRPPTDYPFGERQYTAEDFGGHRWTFSQSIADVDPKEWGGRPGQL